MGSLWMCSKYANLGIDVASAISDYMAGRETQEDSVRPSRNRTCHILGIMVSACKCLVGATLSVDSFFIGLAEGLLRDLDLPPRELITRLEICGREIQNKDKAEDGCLKILRSIAMNAILVASRRLDATPFLPANG